MRRILLLLVVSGAILSAMALGIPATARRRFGPPASGLSATQVIQYSAELLWADGLLTRPTDPGGTEQEFEVQDGESIASVCARLQTAGLIGDASMLREYLVYTGLDMSVQAGRYKVSPAMSIVDVAHRLQDATPSEVTFVILPGWRIEEIAASLPTSGLSITPAELVAAASARRGGYNFLAEATTSEGFLFPDAYIIARTTTVDELVDTALRNFALHLTVDLQEGFSRQGLSVYQAVTLASIVEREAVRPEEAATIASVYLNRLKIGMRLDADPTVQYALGYNALEQSWWTNPLGTADLAFSSPYNTYLHDGLPPAPIDNAGLDALRSVASPAEAPYYYFSARCDGSGYHQFARTFEEHLQNLCP